MKTEQPKSPHYPLEIQYEHSKASKVAMVQSLSRLQQASRPSVVQPVVKERALDRRPRLAVLELCRHV